jgi:hypothetical protein
MPNLNMRSLIVFAIPALITSFLAGMVSADYTCLNGNDVNFIVGIYQKLIENYTAADAEAYVASNFVEYSDSINMFAGIPLGNPTFPSKGAFMAAQAANPPFPITIHSIDIANCDRISLIWSVAFGRAMKSVRGMTEIFTAKNSGVWQIWKMNVEFNSLVWLLNIGGTYQMPT